MNKPIDGGGFAFPQPDSNESGWERHDNPRGMSLRDYFAGQALAGLCANPEATSHFDSPRAYWAYKLADAMLEARKVQP
jgi:hypothetical protein